MYNREMIGLIVKAIKRQKWLFLIFLLFEIPGTLEYNLIPATLGKIVDGFAKYSDDRSNAIAIVGSHVLLYMSLWAVLHISLRIAGFARAYFVPQFCAYIRMKVFKHVLDQPNQFFIENLAGNVAGRISMFSEKLALLIGMFVEMIFPFCVAVGSVFWIATDVKGEIVIVMFAWFAAHMLVCVLFGKKCVQYEREHTSKLNCLNGDMVDSIVNNGVVRIFNNEQLEYNLTTKSQANEILTYNKSLKFLEVLKSVLAFFTIAGGIFGISFTGYIYWKAGEITIGEFIFVINSSIGIVMFSWYVGLQLSQFFSCLGSCLESFGIFYKAHDIIPENKNEKLVITKGKISVKNISFYYGSKPLFKNLSIEIEANEKVGIVGYSGSGKSSFCNLFLRLYDLAEGEILIDGQNIRDVSLSSLRRAISVVPQDIGLFHRTIFENIRYGNPEATYEEVIQAAKEANVDEFVQDLPDKYQTDVGEGGARLSSGQRQRIIIARAILKNSKFFILDEVTSALDSISENLVQDALTKLMQNKTVLAIAHRLSTIKKMDRIIVFNKGSIVEIGSHEELLENGAIYRNIWNSQKNGFIKV